MHSEYFVRVHVELMHCVGSWSWSESTYHSASQFPVNLVVKDYSAEALSHWLWCVMSAGMDYSAEYDNCFCHSLSVSVTRCATFARVLPYLCFICISSSFSLFHTSYVSFTKHQKKLRLTGCCNPHSISTQPIWIHQILHVGQNKPVTQLHIL